MRMKKLFSLLCAAAIALSAVGGLPAAAEEPGEETAEVTEENKTWQANFKYDEETGVLSWDICEEAEEYMKAYSSAQTPGQIFLFYVGNESSTNSRWIFTGFTYWWDGETYSYREVALPVMLAYKDCFSKNLGLVGDLDFTLSVDVYEDPSTTSNLLYTYTSADSFSYHYDGCDLIDSLGIPANFSNMSETDVCWDKVENAVGYLFRWTGSEGTSSLRTVDSTPEFSSLSESLSDGDYAFEVCAVDKNGDRSEWSEPVTLTVKDNKFTDIPLTAVETIEIDASGNLIWSPADGASGYSVHITGDGVDLIEKTTENTLKNLNTFLKAYPDGDYTIEVTAYNERGNKKECKEPLIFAKVGESLFDKDNETTSSVESTPDSEKNPESDRITSITINPAFNMKNKNDTNVELDLTKIKIKAQEIYDEEGLKRAEEALGEEIIGNKHYNLLDLTLLYNDQDFSNGYDGLVQVIIPLPTGHRDKTFSCYRLIEVNGEMTKEVIPGEQTEDSYIIYLEHFSEYALVADGGETPAPAKQGFYSDGSSILTAEIGMTVTQKTEVKDGKQDVRFIQKVNAAALNGKSKATFTLTANGVTKEVSTTKYYTGLTFDDGTKATAASGQVFLCYTVTDVPENVTVEATSVVLE